MGARVGKGVIANGACDVANPMHDDATARGNVIFLMTVFGCYKETKRMRFEQVCAKRVIALNVCFKENALRVGFGRNV